MSNDRIGYWKNHLDTRTKSKKAYFLKKFSRFMRIALYVPHEIQEIFLKRRGCGRAALDERNIVTLANERHAEELAVNRALTSREV